MFGFFINQLNTDSKELYQKANGMYKKRIRIERPKKYFEICIKHNHWLIFTDIKGCLRGCLQYDGF